MSSDHRSNRPKIPEQSPPPESTFRKSTRHSTSVGVKAITQVSIEAETSATEEVSQPIGLRERTDPYHRLPTPVHDDKHWTDDIITHLSKARAQLIYPNDRMLNWLEAIEETNGTHILELESQGTHVPFRLVVSDGALCFGPSLHEQIFLDVEFKRAAPALCERLPRVLGTQRMRHDDPILRTLIPADELELTAGEHAAVVSLLERVLERCTTRHELSNHTVSGTLELPFEPLAVRPLELIKTPLDELPRGTSAILDDFDEIAASAKQAWLFDLDYQPFTSIAATGASDTHTIVAAKSAKDMLDHFLFTLDTHPLDARLGVALDADSCWTCVVDERFAALYEHPKQRLGRVMSALRRTEESHP